MHLAPPTPLLLLLPPPPSAPPSPSLPLPLQADILTCAEQLDRLEQEFHQKVVELQATVQAKTAVPTSQVYVSQ